MRGMIPGLPNPFPLSLALPSPYQDDTFADRFLSAFDDILAPVLTTLDNVDGYLDPLVTPPDFLPWLAGWVGLELDENWSQEQQRSLVATAVDLLAWRGTRRGIEELLRSFLGIEGDQLEVTDSGGAAWSVTPDGAIPGSASPTLTVRVRVADPDGVDKRRLEHLVAASTPAHVRSEVEVVAA